MKVLIKALLCGALALATAAALPVEQPAAAPAEPKVLRYAFNTAETGFDPARIVDLYSRIVTSHIFEALYTYDHLARPAKIRPLVADGMPEHSADFRTWTVKLKKGIYFADDPAFNGQQREVVASDFVYAFKRPADPETKSPIFSNLLEMGFIGLKEAREKSLKERKPFDYDSPMEGLRALDRHTIQFRLEQGRPRLLEFLAASDLYGAVAREVVEKYGDAIPGHPVGTGPFRLAQWRRSSLIVLERNPTYREVFYEAEPGPNDTEGQALVARFKGRRLPMVDRVEVSIIEESQPRWLAFLNGQLDFVNVPGEFVSQAVPGGKIAPNLAKRGMRGYRVLQPDVVMTYFNIEDPVVGGYTPEKVALRRAIGLGVDLNRQISVIYRGQGLAAQSTIAPHTTGYDPKFKSENGDFDPERAKALLDMYGYVDRDGDGWRELPDGQPLVLEMATQTSQFDRQYNELWKKDMQRIGVKISFKQAQWPEQLKAARAGKLQMWALGSSADTMDGQGALARLYGPEVGSQNLARFKNEEFDRIYRRMQELPDGAERDALFVQAKRLAVAYMPYKIQLHRYTNDVVQPWLLGFRRPVFWNEWWHMVDVDNSLRPVKK